MFNSPFGEAPKPQQPSIEEAEIVFVADAFSEHYIGGAELTTDALIEKIPARVVRVLSQQVTPELIQKGMDKHWVFCNFSSMDLNLIPTIVSNLYYSIIEYDYKFCKWRSIEKHKSVEGEECNCQDSPQGKYVSAFFHGAEKVFWMSEKQHQIYVDRFPFLKGGKNHILSSVFTDSTLDTLANLRENTQKDDKWIIVGSTSWIKGVQEAEKLCKEKNLDYEVVWKLPHSEMLQKFASSKGFVFTPLGGDTCPRTVIEARLAGCEVLLNENVQHKDEDWFKDKSPEEIDAFLRTSGDRFWKAISGAVKREETVSGYTTTRNCIEQKYPFEQSIKSMLGFCDQVVVVDGGSTDGTWERLEALSKEYDKLIIEKRERDWNHPRFAVFDGLQKAYARSLCTSDWCWQQDSDEIVHEDDYLKVKTLMKKMPKALELMALPVVEYWGSTEKVRVDVNPWKWRLSKNRAHITHGIPKQLRRIDENGDLYASPGTDGCDYVDAETFEIIPCANFYDKHVHEVRIASLRGNQEALKMYQDWFENVINNLPGVYHYSWLDIKRKIYTYKNYWSKHWQSLYNVPQQDTIENNMFFNKKWEDVNDGDIEFLSAKLSEEMGGWVFHQKVDFTKPTPHLEIQKSEPLIMMEFSEQ